MQVRTLNKCYVLKDGTFQLRRCLPKGNIEKRFHSSHTQLVPVSYTSCTPGVKLHRSIMSAYNNEYKQSLAVAENPGIRQAEQLAFDECSERLRKKCHERGAKVSVERGDTSEAQKEACDESIPWMIFSRRACSTKNQPTKSEEVLRLYSAEDACLDKMRQILMSRVTSSNSDKALFLEEFTAEEDAANFQGAYEKLRR